MLLIEELLLNVKSLANKDWARPVPAAAVKPSLRVADVFIGPKTSVGGLVRPTLKTAT